MTIPSGGQQRLDWWAVPGVPLTFVLDTSDGTSWDPAPTLHFGPLSEDTGEVVPVIPARTATVTSPSSRATCTLSQAEVAAILAAYPLSARLGCPWHVRQGSGEGETPVSTGRIRWDDTGHLVSTTATLVVGPPGPTAVSTDAGNAASLGTDGLLYVSAVSSVNGETGAVTMTAADVGAAPALGADDNYVTDAEKAALHAHSNKTALDAVSGTNTGDQDLSGLVAKSLVDAKGDLIVATAADTVARLPVGATTGHVLTVDPAESTGMKWAPPGGGGGSSSIFPRIIFGARLSATYINPVFPGCNILAINPYGNTEGTLAGYFLNFPADISYTQYSINVTTAVTSGLVRVGLWTPRSTDLTPETVVFDSGAFNASTTGIKTVVSTGTIAAGDYWLLAVGTTGVYVTGWQTPPLNALRGLDDGSGKCLSVDSTVRNPADALPNLNVGGISRNDFSSRGVPLLSFKRA